jgi:hypothetical protein
MNHLPLPRIRLTRRARLLVSAGLVAAGCGLAYAGLSAGGDAPARPVASNVDALLPASADTLPPMRPVAADLAAGLPAAHPDVVAVPRLGIRAAVIDTGQRADGTPETPPLDRPADVGWYTASVTPGEHGASVMFGHLDTRTGTAVFHHLGTLTAGDLIQVLRADGKVAEFTVEKTAVYPREDFPEDAVYDDPGYPALRLVTCAGTFDRRTQQYSANVVVFARLSSVDQQLAEAAGAAPPATPAKPERPERPEKPVETAQAKPAAEKALAGPTEKTVETKATGTEAAQTPATKTGAPKTEPAKASPAPSPAPAPPVVLRRAQ